MYFCEPQNLELKKSRHKELQEQPDLSARARQLSNFALASFANFSSVALVQSVAPKINENLKMENIQKAVWKGLLVGFLSSLFNATVAGLIHPLHIGKGRQFKILKLFYRICRFKLIFTTVLTPNKRMEIFQKRVKI